ncbi:MAG: ATP-binding cassette domain-containing protein [Firmicutes bacterium]|nr:ATP-binding cassette domain-containing protein [Bacillota bacterium]
MLQIVGLTKKFHQGTIDEKVALDNINLELAAGEFVTIVGSNGAGKSTLLNCIAGVYEADAGRVFLDGEDITAQPEWQRAQKIGRVFQDPLAGTAYDMSIEENLAIAYGKQKKLGLQPGIRKKEQEFFREQLAQLGLGLENRLKDKVGLLSGGQRQALTLLMATMVRPKLLLLDEHTASLDPVTARKVLALTDKIITEYKLCTLMITHNMQEALSLGTRTIMMDKGKIMLDLQGETRAKMTVEDLVAEFAFRSGTQLSTDRMLLN